MFSDDYVVGRAPYPHLPLCLCVLRTDASATVALKIIRNLAKYREAAKLEINVLGRVNKIVSNGEK